MSSPIRIRPARPDEADAITRLTLRSKRHWGYPEAFMRRVTPALTYGPADLSDPAVCVEVGEVGVELLGFYRLRRRTELAWLEDLFVDPSAMGQGIGRRLFLRAAEVAQSWGLGVMEWESDPFAEPFYRHLGAEGVAMSPSTLIPGRSLPLMRYALRPARPPQDG